MSKRPPPSPIFLEWERIVFHSRREDGTYPPEEERAWRTLWENHILGQNLCRTAVSDAALICRLGWSVAISHGEYAEAASTLECLFDHPDIATVPAYEGADHRCHIALARLLNGEAEVAVNLYRSILKELSGRVLHTTTNIVRNHVYSYCLERVATDTAPDSIVQLAELIVELKQQHSGLRNKLAASDRSFGALAAVLKKTYPNEGPARESTSGR